MANSGVMRQNAYMRHRGFIRSYNFLQPDPTDAFKELCSDLSSSKLFSSDEKPRSAMRKTSENEMRELEKRETSSPPDGCISHGFNLESYVDDNSWTAAVLCVFKIVTCFVAMMFTTFFWAIIMLILLPWPCARIKQGNIYGHFTGRMLMWILGNPVNIKGAEYSNLKAIYVSNHASPLDIFLIMWLTPTGTVGIAKKELISLVVQHLHAWNFSTNSNLHPASSNLLNLHLIIWYPLFGQLYVLANHLRIDRSNPSAAIESMKEAARAVVEKNLSLIIFPEGTRSESGRLLPFKKGFVHLAIQSRRPIVPIVLTGTHLAWRKNSLHVRPAPLTVTYLPPVNTDDWTIDKLDGYVEMLHSLYITHLPDSQKPLK